MTCEYQPSERFGNRCRISIHARMTAIFAANSRFFACLVLPQIELVDYP
jgi:hypothetical protein